MTSVPMVNALHYQRLGTEHDAPFSRFTTVVHIVRKGLFFNLMWCILHKYVSYVTLLKKTEMRNLVFISKILIGSTKILNKNYTIKTPLRKRKLGHHWFNVWLSICTFHSHCIMLINDHFRSNNLPRPTQLCRARFHSQTNTDQCRVGYHLGILWRQSTASYCQYGFNTFLDLNCEKHPSLQCRCIWASRMAILTMGYVLGSPLAVGPQDPPLFYKENYFVFVVL